MENYIGTSGFSYAPWKDTFYPEKLPASRRLEYYATRFNTLELNHTFYRFPLLKTLEKQHDATPPGFVFSVKAHKVITHTLRMRDAAEKVHDFTRIAEDGLKDKLGCILFQLPPSFAYTEENLHRILESIPPEPRNVVEFRHASWWNETAGRALQNRRLTFCRVSYPGLPEGPFDAEGEVFYLRMHGVPELFKSSYAHGALETLAAALPETQRRFVYFNNTMFEAGFRNALTLRSL